MGIHEFKAFPPVRLDAYGAVQAAIAALGARPLAAPRDAHAALLAKLAADPPQVIRFVADADDLEARSKHIEDVLDAVTAFFQNQLNNIGFQYSNNLWYRADMQAQVWGMGFLMMASSGVLHSAPYIWVDVNNEITTFNTEDEALAFVNYLLEWVAAFLRTFNRIKAQILLATTSDAIDAICLAFVSSQPGVYIAPSS